MNESVTPTSSLLKTKLHLPKRASKPVSRSEVVKQFSLERRLTALTAPAGYGKTSVVLEWLESFSCMVGWVSLDEGDNDVNQFTRYLLAACENGATELIRLGDQVSETTSSLSVKYVFTAMINIFVDLAHPTILVLDDYHLVHNPTIHEAMTFLIDNKPSNLHIITSSQSKQSS